MVALTFGGQGEWDWLATCVGVALLTVLAAFFRLGPPPRPVSVYAEVAAMCAVAALAGALVVAAPLQAALEEYSAAGQGCRAGAAVAAGYVLTDSRQLDGAVLAAERLAAEGNPTTAGDALVRAAEHQHDTVLGICLGAATSRWLWLPATVIGLTLFGAVAVRLRRTR